jgi:acyl-CoA reductase-like NAD-dependent aldehyde dehydrogenase
LEIAKLCEEAGVPKGVINVCPGVGEVAGAAIVQNPLINKISFTGSTKVGKQILKDSSDNLKKVSLELGGKAPNILFEDCDIDSCLEANLRGGFFNQGENCTAVTRLLVHSNIIDEFTEKYLVKIKKINQGDPLNLKTEIGALISKDHIKKVGKYVEDGISEGAELLIGGEKLDNLAGYFYPPTVLRLQSDENILFKEEVFGPVVTILSFDSEIEAIKLANKTHYGLAGGIWTKDISKAIRVAKSIEAGYLWINTYGGIIPETPYGGFKQSGYGKELGLEGLSEYLQIKNISIFTGEQIPKWYGDN